MKYLKRLQRVVRRLGGVGRFQAEGYLRQNVSPQFANLLATEAAASGPPTVVLGGAPARGCHANSMTYVMSNGGELWSGFALSGSVWRVHSWVVKNGALIEATPSPRERYVGIPINSPERAAACFQLVAVEKESRS